MQRTRTAILAVLVVILTLGALWYLNRPVITKEPTREDIKAEAQSGGYRLINTAELAALYRQDPQKVLLVDTRQDWEYRTGHIKGAFNFPIEPTWWSRWRTGKTPGNSWVLTKTGLLSSTEQA